MVDLASTGEAGVRTRTPLRYSPTFVLAQDGQEIGRIEGYPGEAFFWGLLERLLEQLPPGKTSALPSPPFGTYQAITPERFP
jgi:hypothetical protein